MQREAQHDDRDTEREVPQAENEEPGGGTDDQVELDAGIPAKQRYEAKQSGAFAKRDDQAAEQLVRPMHQRHAQSHRDERQVDRDDRAIGAGVGQRVGQRVDRGRDHDQCSQGIDDLELASSTDRVAGGAEFDQPAKPLRKWGPHRRRPL